MRERDRNDNKMHIIRKKEAGRGRDEQQSRWFQGSDDSTHIAQQMRRDGISPTAAVKNCRAAGGGGLELGGGGGGKERGRPTELAPALLCCPMEVRAGVYCT